MAQQNKLHSYPDYPIKKKRHQTKKTHQNKRKHPNPHNDKDNEINSNDDLITNINHSDNNNNNHTKSHANSHHKHRRTHSEKKHRLRYEKRGQKRRKLVSQRELLTDIKEMNTQNIIYDPISITTTHNDKNNIFDSNDDDLGDEYSNDYSSKYHRMDDNDLEISDLNSTSTDNDYDIEMSNFSDNNITTSNKKHRKKTRKSNSTPTNAQS